jgi:hypothetical protein
VLRINLFNEVIYIFMWFWLCILAVLTIVDYLTWTARLLIPSDKLRFIKRHLDIYNFYLPSTNAKSSPTASTGLKYPAASAATVPPNSAESEYSNNFANLLSAKKNANQFEYVDVEKEKKLIREFTFKYLKDDGIFAMRILASSASDLIVTEIISELWRSFKLNYSDQAVQDAMADNVTIMSDSSLIQNGNAVGSNHHNHNSSSSSASSTTSSSSAASSPSSLLPQSQAKSNLPPQSASSPVGFTKKPFNFAQRHQDQMKGYSPPNVITNPTSHAAAGMNSIYSNSNVVKGSLPQSLSSLTKRDSSSAIPAPPSAPPPSVTFYGQPPNGPPGSHSQAQTPSDEYSTIKKQQRNAFHHMHDGSNSANGGAANSSSTTGGNPNAKDTHV